MEKLIKLLQDEWGVDVEFITPALNLIFDFGNLIQLGLIVGALFCSYFGQKYAGNFVRDTLHKLGNGWLIQRVEQLIFKLGNYLILIVVLSLCLLIFDFFNPNSYLLRTAIILTNTWIVIQIASILLFSPKIARHFAWVAWTISVLNAFHLSGPIVAYLTSIGFQINETWISGWLILKSIVILVVLLWGAGRLSALIDDRVEKSKKFTGSLNLLISKLTHFSFSLIAVIVALSIAGVDLTIFTVFSGALGIGIGLGLQKTVANMMSGISLLLDKGLQVGDVIEVENKGVKTYGVIKNIGLRYISVLTRDATEVLIPNEIIISSQIVNWSFSSNNLRQKIYIGIAYSSDVERVMELCIEAALENPRTLKDPEPTCGIDSFGDSAINLILKSWISDPEEGIGNYKNNVNLLIWKKFKEHNIDIPFPQREIRIISD